MNAYTKDGTEMQTIVSVDIVWSIQVFFFSAANMPNAMPIGILKIIEYKLTIIVAGSFDANISATS